MYEAASLDGGNSWDKLRHITLPTIKPVMLFVVVISTIASFNIYAQPYLMTRGGPGEATKVLLISILDEAFVRKQMGSASAMAIIMSIIMIMVAIVQYKISKERRREAQ
jgi:multiple sugar transport system permease protein